MAFLRVNNGRDYVNPEAVVAVFVQQLYGRDHKLSDRYQVVADTVDGHSHVLKDDLSENEALDEAQHWAHEVANEVALLDSVG